MSAFSRFHPAEAAALAARAIAGPAVGERSFLVHDLDRLGVRLAALRAAFPDGTLHTVAIKALPLVEVLRYVVGLGYGLEAASWEEVCLALHAGCPAERVLYDAPARTDEELAAALAAGVRIHTDDFGELDRIALLGPGASARIGLRLNPLVGAGSIGATSVASRASHFGVPADQLGGIVEAFARFDWLTSVHVHVGSQGMSVDRLVDGAVVAADVASAIRNRTGDRPHLIDIGGGLSTPYRDGEPPPDLEGWVSGLRRRAPLLFDGTVTVATELGRALHAGCGFAVARVETVKPAPTGLFAIMHLGADLLVRRAWAPNDWHHDVHVLHADGSPRVGPTAPVTVCGPLCFAGDVFARELPLPSPARGDWILIRDTGAYTLATWSRHCSRVMPLVLGVEGGQFRVLRRPERPEDIVRFWS